MNAHRRLAATAVVAVVAVGAAVYLVSTSTNESDVPSVATATAPGAVWTVDASDVLENEFATFEDPVGGRYGEVFGGVVDAGDVLVAEAGLTNQDSKKFERAEFVGIDAASGAVRWTTPADGTGRCSTALLDGKILCRSDSDVVTIDPGDGELTRYGTRWNIHGVGTDGTDVYVVEGDPDGYTVRVHSGSLSDLDENWTTTYDNTWVDSTTFGDIVQFAGGVGVGVGVARFTSGTAVFDAGTGAAVDTFDSPDCARSRELRDGDAFFVIGRRCSDLFEFRTDLVDSASNVIATANEEVWQRLSVDNSRAGDPVLFDGKAYDPRTGAQLWEFDEESPVSDLAIIDGVVMWMYGPARDLRTGAILWEPDVEQQSVLPTAAYDGSAYTVGWQDILVIDPATGHRRASVSLDGLLGNTGGRSEQVALQETGAGVLVVNESRLNLIR